MAFKRYPTRYVRTYEYKDKESGEVDNIVFMANGYLFPLFKSFTGVELGKALEDYKKGLMGVVNKDTMEAIAKFETAQGSDEKIGVVMANSEVLMTAFKAAQDTDNIVGGLSLIEVLLVIMRVCALPEADHAEALAVGIELLPHEIYEDPQFAFELLNMAMEYDNHAKKNSTFRKS